MKPVAKSDPHLRTKNQELKNMKPILLLAALMTAASAHEFEHHKDWLQTPEGIAHVGDSHGEIDVDSKGNFYVSVVGGEKKASKFTHMKANTSATFPMPAIIITVLPWLKMTAKT